MTDRPVADREPLSAPQFVGAVRVTDDRMVGAVRFTVATIDPEAPTLCRDCRIRVKHDDATHNQHRLGAFSAVRDPWIALLDIYEARADAAQSEDDDHD